jgi:murein DD-endopeptidase MepM/ murein hydrolase activator NlpD
MITKDQNETNKLYLMVLFSLIAWLATIVSRNAKIPNNQANQATQSQASNQGTNQGISRPNTPTPTGPIGDFVRPIDGRITSDFGPRIHPTLGTTRHHQGIDIAAPIGTPVKSPWGGVIDSKVDDGVCGLGLRVKHSNGLLSVYCHLSDNNVVSEGAQVTAGQEIAKSGNTGRSTGPHLHWGVKDQSREYVNPMNYWR